MGRKWIVLGRRIRARINNSGYIVVAPTSSTPWYVSWWKKPNKRITIAKIHQQSNQQQENRFRNHFALITTPPKIIVITRWTNIWKNIITWTNSYWEIVLHVSKLSYASNGVHWMTRRSSSMCFIYDLVITYTRVAYLYYMINL